MMKRLSLLFALTLLFPACNREEPADAPDAGTRPPTAEEQDLRNMVSVPLGAVPDEAQMERERRDASWRALTSFGWRSQHPSAIRSVEASFAEGPFNETLEGIEAARLDQLPFHVPIDGDVEGPSVLKVQILLDRAGFSPGMIDGRWGKNTAIAVHWFQAQHGLQPTGTVDRETVNRLMGATGSAKTLRQYQLSSQDVSGPFVQVPDDPYAQSELDCLCYENAMEKLSELFHVKSDLLVRLNPQLAAGPAAGQTIWVPNVQPLGTGHAKDIRRIVVSVAGSYLHGFDANENIVFHGPVTVGSEYDPSPNETTRLVGIAHDPDFHYQPKLFHEVPDDEPEAMLPPGPNSPVGVVWMALAKPHYGIHGTSAPETIGYSSSHGCIRLTNWDAQELAHRASQGIPVEFVDTRS